MRKPNHLERLVLAFVARRVSMDYLLHAGFTSGQVMRQLVALREGNFLEVIDGRVVLSSKGEALANAARRDLPPAQWVVPLDDARTKKIGFSDIYLPATARELDQRCLK